MLIDIAKLVENVDIVEYISQFVDLKKEGKDYFGLCPFHTEKTPSFAVSAKKKSYHCFGCGSGGDLLHFIMNLKSVEFPKALEILCEYVGGDIESLPNISVLTRMFERYAPRETITFVPPAKLKSNVMNAYTKKPIKEWLDEGISQKALDKYQVRYDLQNNKIVYPIWDNDGNIISVCGRTLDPEYKEKKIRKYTYYNRINSTYFFYGFWQNKAEIFAKNEVLIFEGAKSVFLAEDYGYGNAVASMTDRLSPMQIDELIKMHVRDVTICWDKGVSQKQIKDKLGILLRYKNCYAVIDNQRLLKEKDSPVDRGKKVWEKLYGKKIRLG